MTLSHSPPRTERTMSLSRRSFLQASAAGAVGLPLLPAVAFDDAKLDPNLVRLDSGIEPLVRLLEETPRENVVEEVGTRIKKGLAYKDVLAALLLAGVRNVQPRPNVGFKFHAVLVVNSAHLASLASPDRERWLPILWAIDNFKNSQAQTKKESGWRMKPVNEMKLPKASKARAEFIAAMDDWDEGKADAAVAALARTAPTNEVFDIFAHYGCRDFRDIGHKAIYVANAFRTLQCIGWHHAEPVLRSLAYALLQHEGDNPAKRAKEVVADAVGRKNADRAKTIRPDWQDGTGKPEVTPGFLNDLRSLSEDASAEMVVKLLNDGTAAQSLWDSLFLFAGECLMRQPGIVALHTATSLNALRYAFDSCSVEETRKLLLLQAASFMTLFREAMKGRKEKTEEVKIDAVEPAEKPLAEADMFALVPRQRMAAGRAVLSTLRADPTAADRITAAGRRLVFLKGTDSHDYKFSSATIEDYAHVSPQWRDRVLAAAMFNFKGTGDADSGVARRVRAVMG
jgi:hypothetical protein